VIGNKILSKINTRGKANDYGVWGYACRLIAGSTKWSVHSWGAAVDTNTLHVASHESVPKLVGPGAWIIIRPVADGSSPQEDLDKVRRELPGYEAMVWLGPLDD